MRMVTSRFRSNSPSSCTSTHFRNSLHLDLDLMVWALWREWLEQKASSNFRTTRRNALFTTERNVRPRSTWIKLRATVAVVPGLCWLTRGNIRWKPSHQRINFHFTGIRLLWSKGGELCWKSNFEWQKLSGCLHRSLRWYCRWLPWTKYACVWKICDKRYRFFTF